MSISFGSISVSVTANVRDVIRHSVGSHPSSPKTLPPTTMGFGGTSTDADLTDQFSLLTETEMLSPKLLDSEKDI